MNLSYEDLENHLKHSKLLLKNNAIELLSKQWYYRETGDPAEITSGQLPGTDLSAADFLKKLKTKRQPDKISIEKVIAFYESGSEVYLKRINMQYAHAIKFANRLVELFEPHCILTNIAGSVRRGCYEVKDIELVVLPRYEFVKTDLFGNGNWQIPTGYKAAVLTVAENVIKGQFGGRYMQIQLKGGMMLDLFTPQLHDYYRQLAIRTGSADYAHYRLAAQWKKLGWCGTDDGLRLVKECLPVGSGWKCYSKNPTLPPAWKSEVEFFEWLHIPWEQPIYREITPKQKTFLKENL